MFPYLPLLASWSCRPSDLTAIAAVRNGQCDRDTHERNGKSDMPREVHATGRAAGALPPSCLRGGSPIQEVTLMSSSTSTKDSKTNPTAAPIAMPMPKSRAWE